MVKRIVGMKPYALFLALIGIFTLVLFFMTKAAILAWVSGFSFGFAVLVIMLLPKE